MSTKQEMKETADSYWDDFYSNVDINKTYSRVSEQNKLINEENYETTDGRRLKQTYQDKQGYTFTCYKKGEKVTCITINKPHGDDKSQVMISRNQLELDGFSKSLQKKIMKDLPEQVAGGASISEIYQNFHDYVCAGIPSSERPKNDNSHELAQNNADLYFADEDFYLYTAEERKVIAADMRARNTMVDKQVEKIADAIKSQEMQNIKEVQKHILNESQNPVVYAQMTEKRR